MDEPKKFSFSFSKVVKKPNLIPSKPVETEQVEYIKCVEDKTVKLVNEEAAKPKPLPVIPMPPGSSVRDRILEAIRAREEAKSGTRVKKEENGSLEVKAEEDNSTAVEGQETTSNRVDDKPMTLDEMAAKELMQSAKLETTEEKKPDLVITGKSDDVTKKQSTLEDYEDMPIGDFGLAMLRGMGWDPKKGIGLNEKVVVPAAPQVRPKGMGLGADKALALQNQQAKRSADELVMKKGSTLKVITGAYAGMYGKVEGFEELPGRIAVRLALGNSVVSLSEFMVQLVGPTEYSKNAKVMNLDKYAAALDSESKPSVDNTKYEPKHSSNDKPVRQKSRSRSPSSGRSRPRSTRDRSQERSSKRYGRRGSSDSDDYRNRRSSRSPPKKPSSKSRKSHHKSSSNKDKRRKSVSPDSSDSNDDRRSHSSSERLSFRTKSEKSQRSRDSAKEKRQNDADSRRREDRDSKRIDRKPKRRSESSDSDYKSSKSSFSEKRSKHIKHKSDRRDSDSDSSGWRRKKHKKSRK